MVVSEAQAPTNDLQAAPRKAPGVVSKPPYCKRFFKQLWTLLYHKQGSQPLQQAEVHTYTPNLTGFCAL